MDKAGGVTDINLYLGLFQARRPGAVAHLGERRVRNAEVEGSTPFGSNFTVLSASYLATAG